MLALSSLASLPFSFLSMSGKRSSYTDNFKLQVIAFAESINNSMAVRCFSVNEKLERDWRKMQNDLSKTSKSKKAVFNRRTAVS